jgi:hypothetical protein
MKFIRRSCVVWSAALAATFILNGCSGSTETNSNVEAMVAQVPSPTPTISEASPSPAIPNLQAELLDDRHTATTSPIGGFDFKNYTYELPRGWQNPDGTAEIRLVNGRIAPVETAISEDMPDDEKVEARSRRRIGMSYVTAKYLDVDGDTADEAVVILKVETGGNAVPQLVYVFKWKNGDPELVWNFRTGDRADGGLKNILAENGEMVVELFGQDRFLLGQVETSKITGDEEQLCCPTHFTRSRHKWNGTAFILQGKRLTFSIAAPHRHAEENLGDKVNAPPKKK